MSETLPDRATAKSLMTSHLPQYLCNCLLLCGFDTLELISEMKVNSTSSAGDSVHEIEKYVNENVPGDMQYTHMAAPTCKVPPGHRIALQKFIGLVKVKLGMGERDSKRKISGAFNSITKPKKAKVAYDDEANESKAVELRSVYQQVRVAISKWQKKQERRYQELSEFEDFHISVEANEGGVDGELCKVKIRCKCKESVKLQEGSRLNFMLSNWTRHVLKHCPVLKKEYNSKKNKQISLEQCVHSCKHSATAGTQAFSTSVISEVISDKEAYTPTHSSSSTTPIPTPPITPIVDNSLLSSASSASQEVDSLLPLLLNDPTLEDLFSSAQPLPSHLGMQTQGSHLMPETSHAITMPVPSNTQQNESLSLQTTLETLGIQSGTNTLSLSQLNQDTSTTISSSSVFRVVPSVIPVELKEPLQQTGQDKPAKN